MNTYRYDGGADDDTRRFNTPLRSSADVAQSPDRYASTSLYVYAQDGSKVVMDVRRGGDRLGALVISGCGGVSLFTNGEIIHAWNA